MASDEFLERIDAHLARNNELMKEVREEIELMRISYEHQLHVTRHAIERNAEAMKRNGEAVNGLRDATDGLRDAVVEGFSEVRQDLRALTDAVLRVLDRLDGGPQPAGA